MNLMELLLIQEIHPQIMMKILKLLNKDQKKKKRKRKKRLIKIQTKKNKL